MKVHWIAILIVLGAALLAPAVSAKIIEEKDGYVVSTIDEDTRVAGFALRSVSTITQGQRDYYSTYVPSGKTSFSHYLSWGSVANSLALTIETPSGILGTYYDSSDGFTDGRINLKISRAGGLAPGSWPSSVYGHVVSGTETYSYQTSLS
ncbi:peptidase domain-containing protein [Methanoregula sp.]|uniref:peptidase domain-containing protein n=1 Tax=Methanoregula sp. TaxID=2052170 RepID=UPI000CB1838E|nr:peptidase domain-containing protein [Methanoregula sp.]PKG33722.1 MAG: peptidase domain-containing protein [Methanoregula sp.]